MAEGAASNAKPKPETVFPVSEAATAWTASTKLTRPINPMLPKALPSYEVFGL